MKDIPYLLPGDLILYYPYDIHLIFICESSADTIEKYFHDGEVWIYYGECIVYGRFPDETNYRIYTVDYSDIVKL